MLSKTEEDLRAEDDALEARNQIFIVDQVRALEAENQRLKARVKELEMSKAQVSKTVDENSSNV
jgi:hypothetical protein